MRFASPVYGDLKFILEPSRFLFVYPLVRAYALSSDERFPRKPSGTQSKTGPTTARRWPARCGFAGKSARYAFLPARSRCMDSSIPIYNQPTCWLLISMIAAHAWRTAQTLGYARSQRSNHLISEAVGLWTAGTFIPNCREAQVWQNLGAHLLHESGSRSDHSGGRFAAAFLQLSAHDSASAAVDVAPCRNS